MANAWFRLYAEFAHDPKVQMLPEFMQRRYIMLMCLRCSNDLVTLHDDEIAFQLRISAEQLTETKALFVAKGFIDEDWNLINWEKRQFQSDTSSHRVAKHRAAKKKGEKDDVTFQERYSNAPDTDTDTEENLKTLVASATDGPTEAQGKPEGKGKVKPVPSDEDRKAALWLADVLKKANPQCRAPKIDKWADEIRLLREVDGRTHRQVCELFQWAKADKFWAPNIQSPAKLREKWDTLAERRDLSLVMPASTPRPDLKDVL
jgi:hypothetical protein